MRLRWGDCGVLCDCILTASETKTGQNRPKLKSPQKRKTRHNQHKHQVTTGVKKCPRQDSNPRHKG